MKKVQIAFAFLVGIIFLVMFTTASVKSPCESIEKKTYTVKGIGIRVMTVPVNEVPDINKIRTLQSEAKKECAKKMEEEDQKNTLDCFNYCTKDYSCSANYSSPPTKCHPYDEPHGNNPEEDPDLPPWTKIWLEGSYWYYQFTSSGEKTAKCSCIGFGGDKNSLNDLSSFEK